jgi:hypothetical protein
MPYLRRKERLMLLTRGSKLNVSGGVPMESPERSKED